MSVPLKIGVIGLGRMGQLYACTLATRVSGVQQYAVTDISEQARKQVAESFGVSHTFSNASDLMALPELIIQYLLSSFMLAFMRHEIHL